MRKIPNFNNFWGYFLEDWGVQGFRDQITPEMLKKFSIFSGMLSISGYFILFSRNYSQMALSLLMTNYGDRKRENFYKIIYYQQFFWIYGQLVKFGDTQPPCSVDMNNTVSLGLIMYLSPPSIS